MHRFTDESRSPYPPLQNTLFEARTNKREVFLLTQRDTNSGVKISKRDHSTTRRRAIIQTARQDWKALKFPSVREHYFIQSGGARDEKVSVRFVRKTSSGITSVLVSVILEARSRKFAPIAFRPEEVLRGRRSWLSGRRRLSEPRFLQEKASTC